jgi:hypothetical protein
LSPSSRFPLCSHIASTCAWASFHHHRRLGSAIAVSGAHVAGEESALPSFLFLWICTGAAESSLPQVHTLGTLWCCAPVRRRSATEPPPSLILATAVSSTPASSSSSSLSGEQHFSTLLCPGHALQHRHPRAGEPRAAPSGAGRHGCSSHSLDPLGVCTLDPATREAHLCTIWCPAA